MATLGEARLREMEALRALRAANELKVLSSEEDAELKVCVCQKEPAAPMIQCELCRGFFHTGCVPGAGAAPGPRAWLCPQCRRSEKPPLEKVLPLLAALQRIRVRLPEGDALRYMIERTVNWQHRAQQMLYSGNLKRIQDKVGSGLLYSRWQGSAGQLPETNKVRLGRGWDSGSGSMGSMRAEGGTALGLGLLELPTDPHEAEGLFLLYSCQELGPAVPLSQDVCVPQQQLRAPFCWSPATIPPKVPVFPLSSSSSCVLLWHH